MKIRSVFVGAVTALLMAASAGTVSASPATSANQAAASAGTGVQASGPTVAGSYQPLKSAQFLDTRSGNGARGPVAARGTVQLQIAGRGEVPRTGVAAVVLNVTVTETGASGYINVTADGAARTGAANLSFAAGKTVSNAVTVPLGSNGKVALYNGSSRSVRLIADVSGYYLAGTPSSPGAFVPLNSARVLDTRSGIAVKGPLAARGTIRVPVAGRGGVPSTGASAVVLNVTASSSAGSGVVTVFPDGVTRPDAASLSFENRRAVTTQVIVPLTANGRVAIFNGSSTKLALSADVVGYFRAGAQDALGTFVPVVAARALDTRPTNDRIEAVPARGTLRVKVTGEAGVSPWGVSAVALTVTVPKATSSGYLTVTSTGDTQRRTPHVAFAAGESASNLVTLPIDRDGDVVFYNSSAQPVPLVVDSAGYYLGNRPLVAASIDVGKYLHTCAIATTRSAPKCWGVNLVGELGNGTTTSADRPAQVADLGSPATSVSAGALFTCASTAAGAAKCWGGNAFGELGNGNRTDSALPVQVSGLRSGVKQVVTSANSACALTNAGGVMCWGRNQFGTLGNGTDRDSTRPVQVFRLTSGVKAITAGDEHMCALTTTGAVRCWGRNTSGQLGNGTTRNSTRPTQPIGLASGVAAISAGGPNTCALLTTGGLKCWGDGTEGQLGNGSTTGSLQPTQIPGLTSGVSAVSVGLKHVCAVTKSSVLKCWGMNQLGQLGTGIQASAIRRPTAVSGLTTPVTAISAGYSRTCAVTQGQGLLCWGADYGGPLGSFTSQAPTPVRVVGF